MAIKQERAPSIYINLFTTRSRYTGPPSPPPIPS
jgi:hypothetical protein